MKRKYKLTKEETIFQHSPLSGLIHQPASLILKWLLELLNVLWYPWLLALWVMLRRLRAQKPHSGLQTKQRPGHNSNMGLAEDLTPGEAEEATESGHDEGSQI